MTFFYLLASMAHRSPFPLYVYHTLSLFSFPFPSSPFLSHLLTFILQVQLANSVGKNLTSASRVAFQQAKYAANDYQGWQFTSVRNWGESAKGVWTVTVSDGIATDAGIFYAVQLDVFGSRSADTTFDDAPPPPPQQNSTSTTSQGASIVDDSSEQEPTSSAATVFAKLAMVCLPSPPLSLPSPPLSLPPLSLPSSVVLFLLSPLPSSLPQLLILLPGCLLCVYIHRIIIRGAFKFETLEKIKIRNFRIRKFKLFILSNLYSICILIESL